MLLDDLRSFIRQHVMGREVFLDSLPELPLPVHRQFHERGFSNWWMPSEYGGRGLNLSNSVDIVEELAYGDAGFAFSCFVSVISTYALHLFGTSEQRQRFLPKLVRDGGFAAMVGSERAAGSELFRTATEAQNCPGGYLVRGEKYMSTGAAFADFMLVLARVPGELPEYRMLIITPDQAGVHVAQRWPMIGLRASGTYEMHFNDCRVEADMVLAEHGLKILRVALNASRILLAALTIGIARRIRDCCLDYAQEKTVAGHRLLEHAGFSAKLGQMEMEIEVLRTLCKQAAEVFDRHLSGPNPAQTLARQGMLKEALVAKMACGQIGWRLASTASTMFGGLGFTEACLIPKLVRDMRGTSIIEGGDDVLGEYLYLQHTLPGYRKGKS